MSSEGYHEPYELLPADLLDRHRAIASIMEELEAIDWYDQRVAATDDPSLAAVLAHNRDEEKEHAAMTVEWLRRHDPVFARHLETYLFTEGSITEIEHEAEHDGQPESNAAQPIGGAAALMTPGSAKPELRSSSNVNSLGIGSLRGARA